MKRIFIFTLALSTFCCKAQNTTFNKVDVISSNFIIQGETNINKFECQMDQTYNDQQLVVRSVLEGRVIRFDGLKLSYPVIGFECGIKAMSKDLQKTLKSDQFPCLSLQINEIRIANGNDGIEHLKVFSEVTITLAGKKLSTTINEGEIINHDENSLTLKGNKIFKMTDFGIEPPTKFFGLVQVTNDLKVAFEINLKTEPVE